MVTFLEAPTAGALCAISGLHSTVRPRQVRPVQVRPRQVPPRQARPRQIPLCQVPEHEHVEK